MPCKLYFTGSNPLFAIRDPCTSCISKAGLCVNLGQCAGMVPMRSANGMGFRTRVRADCAHIHDHLCAGGLLGVLLGSHGM